MLKGNHDNYVLSPNDDRLGFGGQWDDWSVNWTGRQLNPEPNTFLILLVSVSKQEVQIYLNRIRLSLVSRMTIQ